MLLAAATTIRASETPLALLPSFESQALIEETPRLVLGHFFGHSFGHFF